jgi:predicted DNA-binding transcriptional regulator
MSLLTQTVEKINYETGEVVERQNTVVKKDTKEEYVRFFLNSITGIIEAKLTATEHNVLYLLQKYTINNSNLLFYNKKIRQEIAKKLNIKIDTVRKCVEKLVKTGLVERPERGMYYLNPIHFGRGDWASIKKLRKEIVYEYDFDKLEMSKQGKTIATYENNEELELIAQQVNQNDAIATIDTEVIDNKTTEHTILINENKENETIDVDATVSNQKVFVKKPLTDPIKLKALDKLKENSKKHLVIKEALNAQSSVEICEVGEHNK